MPNCPCEAEEKRSGAWRKMRLTWGKRSSLGATRPVTGASIP